MATITATESTVGEDGTDTNVGEKGSFFTRKPMKVFFWETLTETNNDGSPLQVMNGVLSVTFHVFGSDGTGGTLRIEGSNDGTNWNTVVDDTGILADGIEADTFVTVTRFPLQLRVFVEGGTSVDYDVKALVRYE